MSFLLRRNLPWTFAGWRDSFDRANANPPGQPWNVWGFTPCSAQILNNKMRFGSGNAFVDYGGWSFEHSAFTPHWGFEYKMAALRTGAAAEIFRAIFNKESWATVNPSVSNICALDMQYRVSGVNCRAMITTYDGGASAGNIRAEAQIPQSTFDGNFHTWKVLINEDRYLRLYLDGTLYIVINIPAGYQPMDGKRVVNFMNQLTTSVDVDDFVLFDQTPPDPPWRERTWTQVLNDTFDRANGPVGSPWIEIGSNDRARIVSNSYSYNSTTDGSRGILYDTGSSYQRIETVIGGNNGPSGQDASLIVRSNAAGTSGIAANFFNNHIYLSRLTSSMSNDNPGMSDFVDAAASVSSGDTFALCAADDYAWIEMNGGVVLTASGIDSLVPTSQTYAGLRVERHSFTNSASWNSAKISVI